MKYRGRGRPRKLKNKVLDFFASIWFAAFIFGIFMPSKYKWPFILIGGGTFLLLSMIDVFWVDTKSSNSEVEIFVEKDRYQFAFNFVMETALLISFGIFSYAILSFHYPVIGENKWWILGGFSFYFFARWVWVYARYNYEVQAEKREFWEKNKNRTHQWNIPLPTQKKTEEPFKPKSGGNKS